MRTTIDLPDDVLRQLKVKAALEGTTLKALMRSMVEQGLPAPAEQTPAPAEQTPALAEQTPAPSVISAALPSIRLGRQLNLPRPSNAALFELLDD